MYRVPQTYLTPPPLNTHTFTKVRTNKENDFLNTAVNCSLLHQQQAQSERERRLPGCLLYGRPWLLIGQLRVRGSNQPSDSGAQAGPDQLLISGAEDREKRKTGGKENHTSTACLARNTPTHINSNSMFGPDNKHSK